MECKKRLVDDSLVLKQPRLARRNRYCPFASAVKVEWLMCRHYAPGHVKRPRRKLPVLSPESMNAFKLVVEQKLPTANGKLHHGRDQLYHAGDMYCCLGPGQFAVEILSVVVARRLVGAGYVVVHLDCAGIEVRTRSLCYFVVQALERTFRNAVVAVGEYDVLARRHFDAGVARGGA